MRNVYLLITDLHIAMTKANRINYLDEVTSALQDIINVALRYKADGCSVRAILLGDVCDSSITNASEAMQVRELLQFFCSMFDKVWAVVGNHEITYATDNPFWFMVSDIQDQALSKIRRYIQPRSLNDLIAVPDIVQDGQVVFYFNHFGIEPKTPTDGAVRVGLFHQNVGSNDICKMWGTFTDVEEAVFVQAYNYCFFGHMHLAKGKYYLNREHTCLAEWLGSIGRTKVDEVLDDSLQVNIPAVTVEDGQFVSIEDNYITLQSQKECVDTVKLLAAKNSKQIVEQHREVVHSSYKGETLFATLQTAFADTGYGYLLGLLSNSWDEVYHTYRDSLESITQEEEQSE